MVMVVLVTLVDLVTLAEASALGFGMTGSLAYNDC